MPILLKTTVTEIKQKPQENYSAGFNLPEKTKG
jgi:hypothetical protein